MSSEERRAYNREYMRARRELGKCHGCGENAAPGKARCEPCMAHCKAVRLAYIASGQCECGRGRAEGRRHCLRCLMRMSNAAARKRAQGQRTGRCTRCGGETGGYALCAHHREQARINQRESRKARGL